MLRGSHCRFCPAWIEHDDLWAVTVAEYAFPHDRVTDARIGTHEDQAIALFKIVVSVRWCVEAKRLFVSGDGRGHALSRISIAMFDAHAKFAQGTEQGHLFAGDLSGAQEGYRVVAMFGLNGFEAIAECCQRRIPRDCFELAICGPHEWHRRAVVCIQHAEGFPALGASHAQINWIICLRREAYRFGIAEV